MADFVIENLNFEKSDLLNRGEGNASLVVTIKSLNKVIKILKVDRNQKDIDLESIKKKLLNELEFSWNVMNNLFEPKIWTTKYFLINLKEKQLKDIKNITEDYRPNHRKHKTIPLNNYFGILIDDFCNFHKDQINILKEEYKNLEFSGPIFSFEIKPKLGFISKEINDLNVCKYILKQNQKLKDGLIDRLSNYCPLDLFSNNKERVYFALNSLVDNPQNNLKLIINQEYKDICSDSLESYLEKEKDYIDKKKLIDLLYFALNHSFNLNNSKDESKVESNLDFSHTCNYHSKINNISCEKKKLNCNSILKSVYEVQKLDELGSINIKNLNDSYKLENKESFEDFQVKANESCKLIDLKKKYEKFNSTEYFEQQITKFLYSSTAKDCSIMITFQKVLNTSLISNSNNCLNYKFHSNRFCIYQNENDKTSYLFTLALIDLDRKNLKKVTSIYENDLKLIELFKEKFLQK